jgi:hypothetical protein
MYSTATRRPFLPSIVECGPGSCLWVILLPIAQFISTHCLARSTFVFFCSKVIHILYPSSLYQSLGRNSIVRLDSCHILLNVNKHTEQLLASLNFETIYSAPSSWFRNRVRKFHTPPPVTFQAPTSLLAGGSRFKASLESSKLHPPPFCSESNILHTFF